MAATSTLAKRAIALQLDNGVVDGKQKLVSMSLGTMTLGDGYTDQKVWNIKTLADEVLAKTVYRVQKVETSVITNKA